ncbi:hypothetical protein VNO80_10405 [Phaseolus coccineus]|uniref:Uncharacterized protein n=1 Tax=Phaseolus coccineus TaxID=3886 RepID=A0AAN9N8C4_PHACN
MYTKLKVITISNTKALPTPTPVEVQMREQSAKNRNKGQEEGGHHRAQELGDDVDDTMEKGDVASDEGAKGDNRVHVTSGDVGTNGDGDKKAECVGDGRDETGRCGGVVVSKLVEGDAGTRAGKHKDEGGDELSQTRLQRVGSGEMGVSGDKLMEYAY